jgi:PAS domain S-box-containing protein
MHDRTASPWKQKILSVYRNWAGICRALVVAVLGGLFKNIVSEMERRHQSEMTINRENEERYRLIIESSPMAMCFYRLEQDGRLVLTGANPSADRITGMKHQTLLGKTVVEIVPHLAETGIPDMHLQVARGDVGPQSYAIPSGEGFSGCFEVNVFRTGLNSIAVNFIDITERRQSEEEARKIGLHYQALIEKAPDGIVLLNGQGNFKFVSPAARKMFGYSATEEITAHPDELTHPDDLPRVLTTLGGIFEDPSYVPTLQYRFADKQENWIWVESTFSNLLADPNVESIVINFHEITERKRLEQQLLQAQKLEGVGTLAGGIAHDFNNLLAMILGSAELLQHSLSDQPELKKFADRIIEASERGASISRQLLIFSRPDQVKLKPISLSHTISELQEMLRHFLPKSIAIETSMNVENGIIMGDSGQIHQALLNLALNAGDAMTNRGTLTIKEYSVTSEFIARQFSADASVPYVAISVTDTGIGMEEPMLAKIFDPFFSTKERGKGTGLGLAMVHGIVKNHNGFIDVKSTPEIGTTFTLYFPALMHNEEERVVEHRPIAEKQNAVILLVDDEEHIREMQAEYLEICGYQIFSASNGAEALEVFRAHPHEIDLVITDLGMPQMGGEELFRKLKKIDAHVNVMVSSGYLDGITREHLLHMGIRDVLTKPSKLQDIQKAIRAVLEEN